ncbi:MAG: S26 family signal peptidase [Chitinispirillaceae bacterium]|nr:S26 family signal peptidase [Chitinispirillaceae bacterium]
MNNLLSKTSFNPRFDVRVTVYRATLALIITAAIACVVKVSFVDTVKVAGDQMSPTIIRGDRVLMLRTPFLPPVRHFLKPPYDRPVVYKIPSTSGALGLLRVAASGRDTLRIDSGVVVTSRSGSRITVFHRQQPVEVVPESYSPQDFFAPYRIPAAGDLLLLDRLTLRDFFFARSVIQQEHPKRRVTVNPSVLLDDSLSNDYIINDFAFYSGHIDSVPDSLRDNWFFWNRLEEYLYQKHDDRKVTLDFSLSLDNTVIEEYRVKDSYFFMLADNRTTGLDSRYFGPVRRSCCIGRAIMVLWSHGNDEQGKWRFRFKRLGRFVS